MDEPWRLGERGRRWFDVVLPLVLLLPVAAFPFAGVSAWWSVLGILQIGPLVFRRRHAVAVFGVVAAASGLQALVLDEPLWSQVAFPVAVYSVARYARTGFGVLALAAGTVGAAVAALDWLHGFGVPVTSGNYLPYFLTITTIVVASWALGALGCTREAHVAALVERAERLSREARQQAELGAAQERARIAREMHDVVAHGLSVIVVQADGARYAAARDPALATETLATIAATGREALVEMRRLVGLLRTGSDAPGTDPQPGLADVAELAEEARAGGAEVHASVPDRWPTVPDGVGLTVYRVVQEALSNVRRHAGPGVAVDLRVATTASEITVEVEDDGRGATARPGTPGPGLGLVGMRERVSLHDGSLETGPRPGGGFRVAARIPW